MLSAILEYESPRSLFRTAAPLHFVWSANFWLSVGINAEFCHWVPVYDHVLNELTQLNICDPHRILPIISFGNKIPLEYFVNNVPVSFEHCSTRRYDMALSALFIYINRKVQHQNVLFLYSFWLYCCCLKLGMRAPF
jgi:hypothetical protein